MVYYKVLIEVVIISVQDKNSGSWEAIAEHISQKKKKAACWRNSFDMADISVRLRSHWY